MKSENPMELAQKLVCISKFCIKVEYTKQVSPFLTQ